MRKTGCQLWKKNNRDSIANIWSTRHYLWLHLLCHCTATFSLQKYIIKINSSVVLRCPNTTVVSITESFQIKQPTVSQQTLAISLAIRTESILRAAHLIPETTSCESTFGLKGGGIPYPFCGWTWRERAASINSKLPHGGDTSKCF